MPGNFFFGLAAGAAGELDPAAGAGLTPDCVLGATGFV